MGYVIPIPVIWTDEVTLTTLMKGTGLGLMLASAVVMFVTALEANILLLASLFGVTIASLLAEIVFRELRLFAITHPSDAIPKTAAIRLEMIRAVQARSILSADILRDHMCEPSELAELRDEALLRLIRRNYAAFNYIDPYLKNEMRGCLKLLDSVSTIGEVAVSSTMMRTVVNAINISRLTRDVARTIQYFDRGPAVRMLMGEQKKLFRAIKEYTEERVQYQKFNSLRNLYSVLQEIADEYD
jgi:hypothetical protein